MIPFEYTMVKEDETFLGIHGIMAKDLDMLKTQGIPESTYPQELDREIRENLTNPVGYAKKSMWYQKSNPREAIRVAEEGLRLIGDNHLLYHSRAMVLLDLIFDTTWISLHILQD